MDTGQRGEQAGNVPKLLSLVHVHLPRLNLPEEGAFFLFCTKALYGSRAGSPAPTPV